LVTNGGRVVAIRTGQGDVTVPPDGLVVIAAATIESARLVRLSFDTLPNADLAGQNLMTHLRSNITIRVPRAALSSLPATATELQASALFVKGRHPKPERRPAISLAVTAAGLGCSTKTAFEAELFKGAGYRRFEPFKSVADDHHYHPAESERPPQIPTTSFGSIRNRTSSQRPCFVG
jgi:hypothetical protein